MGATQDSDSLDLRDFRAVSVLGRGAKGVVFLAHHKDHQSLALKVIPRSVLNNSHSDGYRRIWFERDVLSALRHPLLPSLRGFVSTDEIVAFAIDRCPGGDLNALRKRQTEKMFSENTIRFYAAEIVLALEHLHGLGIVYRDLKPENVLIQSDGHLMLVDFDLSTRLPVSPPREQPPRPPRRRPSHRRRISSSCFPRNSGVADANDDEHQSSSSSSSRKSNSFVGTEEYVAPEVIEGKGHDYGVDWWSLGVVMYEMLYGRTPFRGNNRKETFYRILSMAPDLVGESTELRDLIGRLLEKDPSRRIGCEEVKRHPFFGGVDWGEVMSVARPPYIPGNGGGGGVEGEGIDVEVFVREMVESIEAKKKVVEKGKKAGNWVGGVVEAPSNKVGDFGVF